jgi:hypothetical protein
MTHASGDVMTVVILSFGACLKLRIVTLTVFFSTTCLARAVFERLTVWFRTLRLKFGGDLYCKLNGFFYFLPHRDSIFSVSAERTPIHWLRKARSATGNKPGDFVWCGMGY